MKTTNSPKTSTMDGSNSDTLSQLRPVKQAAAFLLLLFATLFFALFMSSCGDDKNEEDLDLDLDFTEENTTLSVSGEVNGNFKAIGQYIEHYNDQTQLYVSSFHFFENDDPDHSQFHITITRYANSSIELGEHLHSIDNSLMEDEEMSGFGAAVLWSNNEDYDTAYSAVENSSLKIDKVTSSHISGEFTLNVKAVGYADETPSSLSISGSFKIPRIKI